MYASWTQQGREGGFVRAAADMCMVVGAALWMYVQWTLVQPAIGAWELNAVVTAMFQGAFAIALGLACAVVTPALWAALFPNTAAAQLLQEARRAAWGFYVIAAAAGFLTYYAFTVIASWWTARIPDDRDLVLLQTVVTMIMTIVVPAWAFNYSSPTSWLAEVQQAHQVKKLRVMHAADIAAVKVAYFRAVDKLRVGLVNLSAEERAEVIGVLAGMQRAQNDTLAAIAGSFRAIAGVEMAVPTLGDDQIVARFDALADSLERRILAIADAPDEEDIRATDRPIDRPTAQAPATGRHGPSRAGATAHAPDRTLSAARAALSGGWTRADLEQTLSISKSAALDLISRWKAFGVVEELDEKYHYRFIGGAS